MTELLILVIIGLCGYELVSEGGFSVDSNPSNQNPLVVRTNKWNLPDIDSSDQHGVFKRDYDDSFERASAQTGVPFALIKAHAVRESSLNPRAYHSDGTVGSSYGLMQVEWNASGKLANRLAKYGPYGADQIRDGSLLYDPDISAYLGACIIRDNLDWLKGNLRDAINAYNTGHAEAGGAAPANYVNDVLTYYGNIVGEVVG